MTLNKSALAGKVAVVTGASAGIGEAIARNLSEAGVKLMLTARRADRLAYLKDSLPTEAAVLAADIADPETPQRLLDGALAAFGRVDILINNAGVLSTRPIDAVDLDVLATMIRVNFEAVVRSSYVFAKVLKAQQSGAIINVSSIGAFTTVPTGGVYSGVKAAVESFSAALRVELAGSGVRVGTVVPGSVATEILDVAKAAGEQTWEQQITPIEAEDIAAAVRFMLEQPPRANIARMQVYSSQEFV